MSLFSNIRALKGVAQLLTARASLVDQPETMKLDLALPGLGRHAPALWKLGLHVRIAPEDGGGESLHVRAHIQTNFASGLKPLLDAPTRTLRLLAGASGNSRARSLATRVDHAFQNSLPATIVHQVRGLLGPLMDEDLNQFVEIQVSTGKDAGSVGRRASLLPAKLGNLGIRAPVATAHAPGTEHWQGRMNGSFAEVNLLRADKRHLPAAWQALLGGRNLTIDAAVVNVADRRDEGGTGAATDTPG